MARDEETPPRVRAPRVSAATCEQEGCEQPATVSYIWPGTGKRYVACDPHAQHASVIVQTMGLVLELLPLERG